MLVEMRKFYMSKPKFFGNLSVGEVIQHLQIKFMGDFMTLPMEKRDEIRSQLVTQVELWQMEYKYRGMNFYSILWKREKFFKNTQTRVFVREVEKGRYDVYVTENIHSKNIRSKKFENLSQSDALKIFKEEGKRDLKLYMEKRGVIA